MEKNNLQKENEVQENVIGADRENNTEKASSLSILLEIIKFAILALIIIVPLRMYVASPFIVSGSSMDDTFHNGDYLIVDQISYKFEKLNRGDIIIFKYPKNTSKYFIKRIIGLPGETVQLNGNTTTIKNDMFPGGFVLDEPYISSNMDNNISLTLANDEYFVMGDNRAGSSDSRYWGPLREKFIRGEAFVRLFPLTKIGLHPGSYKYNGDIQI